MKITKAELVKLVQAELAVQGVKVSLKDTQVHLDAFLAVFAEQTKAGNCIAIPGAFSVKATEKEERTAISPSTGEEVVVEAHTAMKLTLAKDLRKVK